MNGHYYYWTVAFIGLVLILSAQTIEGHKCYVCAPNVRRNVDVHQLKQMFGNAKIPKCTHYHKSRIDEFIQECPKESSGCLTKFEGQYYQFDGSMMRTCAPISIDDCKVANGVTYCYCKNELCNTPGRKLSTPGSGIGSSPHNVRDLQIVNTAHLDPDDMDYYQAPEEGSGSNANYDYDHYPEEEDEDYGPESEDQTEPPLFITEEKDLYRKPTGAPKKQDLDDFGFVDETNRLDFIRGQQQQLPKNALNNHHQVHHSKPSSSPEDNTVAHNQNSFQAPVFNSGVVLSCHQHFLLLMLLLLGCCQHNY